ncbi:unnamed protein product [Discosporangium mesarthrocarpum]
MKKCRPTRRQEHLNISTSSMFRFFAVIYASWGAIIACGLRVDVVPPRAAIGGMPGTVNALKMAMPPTARWLGATLIGVSVATAGVGINPALADLSRSPECIDGTGSGCEELSGGSELIKNLQARSAQNRERYEREMLDTYNQHNFADYFKAENKRMVRHKNGQYEILSEGDYIKAERAGTVWANAFVE